MERLTEGWTVGLFADMSEAESAVRSMTAMLNRFNEATVVIGMDKDGRPTGIRPTKDDVEAALGIMASKMNRMPDASVSIESDGEAGFIVIRAVGYETPYSFGSWFYTRKCNPVIPKDGSRAGFEWKETLTCGMKRHRGTGSNNLRTRMFGL